MPIEQIATNEHNFVTDFLATRPVPAPMRIARPASAQLHAIPAKLSALTFVSSAVKVLLI